MMSVPVPCLQDTFDGDAWFRGFSVDLVIVSIDGLPHDCGRRLTAGVELLADTKNRVDECRLH